MVAKIFYPDKQIDKRSGLYVWKTPTSPVQMSNK